MAQPPKFNFRFTGPGRCVARYGLFHASIDDRRGTYRSPYQATLKYDGRELARSEHRAMPIAQSWLRDMICSALEDGSKFELADYASEADLEAKFKRRAEALAKRKGLLIIGVTQSETRIKKRPVIVRNYSCLRLPQRMAGT